jgi:hypothetical protein
MNVGGSSSLCSETDSVWLQQRIGRSSAGPAQLATAAAKAG